MTKKKSSLANVLVLFLLLFFSGIVLFVLFAVLNIGTYDVFPAVLTFSIINLIILLIIGAGGSSIAKITGIASFISICVVTAIYTLLQFIHLGFSYHSISITYYVLYHLIVLFLYLLIIIPIALMGARNRVNSLKEDYYDAK